jgi:YHS domain-containing protein
MERKIDPICGMEVDPTDDPFTSESQGITYYFCSAQCKDKFDANPQNYTQNRPQAVSAS